MESKSQNAMPNSLQSNNPGSSSRPPDPDQRGQANGADWQEEVYQKIKTMKEMYLPELNEMYQKIAAKLQQHDSLPQQLKSDQLEKLKIFKTLLERIITFLQVSKNSISPGFKEKLGSYEKQIANFISTNRPRTPVSSMQPQGQLPPPHMHSMQQQQSQISQGQPFDNQQMQSMNLQASLDTTDQRGQANGADWQEEVYQKIKTMKEMYLPELNEMYRKIAAKLQQLDSVPHQPKSDQHEKVKMFKTMFERIIAFLQVSKNSVSPGFKEKLGSYEKQILNFISTNRCRTPVSSIQQQVQLPPPHMHSMQQQHSQIGQWQPHHNQQMQSMNLRGSMPHEEAEAVSAQNMEPGKTP